MSPMGKSQLPAQPRLADSQFTGRAVMLTHHRSSSFGVGPSQPIDMIAQ